MESERHFGLRIEDQMLKKFRHVCEYDGRSANSKILLMIRKCITEFEAEHGPIHPNSDISDA